MQRQFPNQIDRIIARAQIIDVIELTWAALPLARDYATVRHELDRLLAAAKTTRPFTQPTWGSARPKSSLDGERESVLQRLDVGQRFDMGIRPGEELSAVDLLKRFGRAGERQDFPSTTHMAAIPFFQQLVERLPAISAAERLTISQAWEHYRQGLERHYPAVLHHERIGKEYAPEQIFHLDTPPFWGQADGTLFFPERISEAIGTLDKSSSTVAPSSTVPLPRTPQAKQTLEDLEALYRILKTTANIDRPRPYYAILVADGDGMGNVIKSLAKGDMGIDQHQQFSSLLEGFAQQARTIIQDHHGAPVYTGGDDVLAILPLHRALGCARTLADAFSAAFTSLDLTPTLSAGMAIVHHLDPLRESLGLARDAEKTAKQFSDSAGKKNALAVTLQKRSGAPVTVMGHWGAIDARLTALSDWLADNELPDGLAYEWRALARRFYPPGGDRHDADTLLHTIIAAEAGRILQRKDASEHVVQQLTDWLASPLFTLDACVNEIIVARILAESAYRPVKGVAHDHLDHRTA